MVSLWGAIAAARTWRHEFAFDAVARSDSDRDPMLIGSAWRPGSENLRRYSIRDMTESGWFFSTSRRCRIVELTPMSAAPAIAVNLAWRLLGGATHKAKSRAPQIGSARQSRRQTVD